MQKFQILLIFILSFSVVYKLEFSEWYGTFLNTFVLSHKKESSDADRQSRVLFEGGGKFSCSLCSKLQPLLYSVFVVRVSPLHMSSYCFWMAENCCVSRRNILYNVGNGLLVFVVQCYPPSFLSQVSIFLTSHSHVHWVPFKNAITRAFSQPTTIYHLSYLKRMVAHACIFILTW